MLLYIFVAIWPLIVGWLYYNKPLAIGNNCLSLNKHIFLALFPIFILLAFRSGDMGADTGTYMRHFTHMLETPLEVEFEQSRMEHGYLAFAKGLTYITHSEFVYQVICVSIMMIALYLFLIDLKERAFYCLFFYVTLGLFFFMFTGVRQCLAMALCLIAYKFAKNRKYLCFVLLVLLAYALHKSSILFLIVPIISGLKVSLINTGGYVLAALVAGRYLDQIQVWFNEQLEYNYEIESTGSGMIFLLVLVVLTVFCMIVIYNKNNDFNIDLLTRNLININFITLFFWIMRLQTRVAERPSYYFLFFSCALYAEAMDSASDDRMEHALKFLVCAFSLILFIYRLRTNFASLVPYQFY